MAGELQEAEGAVDVDVVVEDGLLDGGPDPGPGRDVDHRVDAVGKASQQLGIPDVSPDESESGVIQGHREVLLLDGRIVEVVEVVQAHHRMAGPQEALAQVGPDEPCRSGNQDLHERVLAPASSSSTRVRK